MGKRTALLLLATILLTSCGGGGTRTNNATNFAGTYSGPWTSPPLGQSGQIQCTVTQAGVISGTITNTTLSINGTFTGNIQVSTGALSAVANYGANGTNTFSGSVARGGNDHLLANYIITANGSNYSGTFDLTPQ